MQMAMCEEDGLSLYGSWLDRPRAAVSSLLGRQSHTRPLLPRAISQATGSAAAGIQRVLRVFSTLWYLGKV